MCRLVGFRRGWKSRGMVVVLAAAVLGFCFPVSAPPADVHGACPESGDASPRFCAQPGMADHALVMVGSLAPVAAAPELAFWVPLGRTAPLAVLHYPATPPPRGPPA
jgi:hypothetical protein